MIGIAFLLAQVGGAQVPAAAQTQPDIEIRAQIRAREVTVHQEGEASVTVHGDPAVTQPVQIERSAPAGASSYRDLTIEFRAAAHIDPDHTANEPAARVQTGENQ